MVNPGNLSYNPVMIRKITVRGIVLHEGKLLCAKLKPYKDRLQKQSNHYWCIPGGGLEEGETLAEGVEREMIEETGIQPVVGNLLYVQQFVQDKREYIEFFFHIANGEDYLHIDLSKTTHGEEEIEEIRFIDPTTHYVLPKFLSSEDLINFAASNAPTRIFYPMKDKADAP
jgi:ADP-ribose pyrophosphatase YjhB (NUDIX family)